ncbi:MAG: hypothetical protein IJV00_03185 [Clostridia bacterium]|nr:hypothetical protein [Clostridia bacterium]
MKNLEKEHVFRLPDPKIPSKKRARAGTKPKKAPSTDKARIKNARESKNKGRIKKNKEEQN